MTSKEFPEKVITILDEVSLWLEMNLENYFVLVFGSLANGTFGSNSDIDIIVFSPNYSAAKSAELSELFIRLCEASCVSTKAQIPHHLSIICSFDRIHRAKACEGFNIINNAIVVPPRIEDPKFYTSEKMLMRFSLNALTSPHIFLSGDYCEYRKHWREANITILRIIVSLRKFGRFTVQELVENYIYEPNGLRHEGRFLGYKDNVAVRSWLKMCVEDALSFLQEKDLISYENGRYSIVDNTWWESYSEAPKC